MMKCSKFILLNMHMNPVWGVLSEKSGGGERPVSQNPYPIYDQNQWFSLPYLWPDQKYDTLYMTVEAGKVALNIVYEGLLLMVLSL